MKKHILFMIASLFLFIGTVNGAKCTVVSGTGKNIGDEVACGTENFYIIKNDETNIKMLAKYNLYVGANFNKITVDSNTYVYTECVDSTCENLKEHYSYYFEGEEVNSTDAFIDKISSRYDLENVNRYIRFDDNITNRTLYLFIPNYSEKKTIDGKTYVKTIVKIYPYTVINSTTKGYALQNKLALGVTGEKGNANYPIYATLPLFIGNYGVDGWENEDVWNNSTENHDNFIDGYINFDFNDNSNISVYLSDYHKNLKDMGYEVSDVDILNMKELNDLVKEISGKNLPLSEWYTASKTAPLTEEDGTEYATLGDLKNYVSNDYKWLWNSTYWTNTSMGNLDVEYNPSMLYFVSSAGTICYSGSDCYGGIPRAGIRPVITLAADQVEVKAEEKNPKTGIFLSYIIIVLFLIFGMISYIISQKKLLNKIK